ncbi:UvrD-helicase domain-containing protein [Legionella shakespearei]|uniref:DNA 3'-5' helicase n=1 Tax=Legionella shakespearei DSM 23087 TaxID=1122169 RepID=A0A0W0Z7D6_9GAMM|nr:UvrD-helicase domain-containing protein [Legionella shakespearei]KTD65040.1 UvrD/REP helicase [Legionella shakespearei DSM 23087]
MTLIDGEQRSLATDPGSSFIVQAPAGSGKTEILTQRYLRLLSTVTAPEQIVALTFTRKAASEMRERIVIALQQAASNHQAASPHQQKTLDFAGQALKRSEAFNWDLLQQPNRLKIITIDSLCQMINQAIPLLEKQIAYSQITDKPDNYYVRAARQCISFAIETPEYQQAIKTLLLHLDNRQDRLISLFKNLLSQRDQWLSPLFQAKAQDKALFEQALRHIEQHELNRFKKSLPVNLAAELVQLSRELATIENKPDSKRYLLKDWYDFQQSNQDTAKALCHLVLGSDNGLRKSFDHHVGLNKSDCSAEEFKRLKSESSALLEQLNEYPEFLDALLQTSNLPNPEYDPGQWDVLQALFLLLPLLVGHLHLIFSEQNEIDFTGIAQQALSALGDADNPADLALYLDNAIHHLLVDEFQDTSITQFELLEKLVQGWQNDDGKTLFIVGDPMQSIYRFRQAEVGLFFRAKEQGIGPVRLQSLELRCNFRSTETIVNWVNAQFSKVFPQQVDIESGAVSFHPSVNIIKGDEHSAIHAVAFKSKEQEAQCIIQLIEHELTTNPQQSLAILVRSRTQLVDIITLLRQNNIPYQGSDIDLLANLVHLRDVWSLTQALLNPGNRLSWLSVLRGPYCGLGITDLHLIAQHNQYKSIYSSLLQLEHIAGLSDEGRTRARFFTQVMHQALTQRYQTRLSEWVLNTLKQLHADKILNHYQRVDLEQLWVLLDRYELNGRLPDMNEFVSELNKLYSQQVTPSPVQIMTIHKSKGLEFDTVFLPGLGSRQNQSDESMLRWLKLPTEHQDSLLLVSPLKGAHQEHCPLYDYLTQLDEEKNNYEAQRVLYVAATRAKSRLYLFDSSGRNSKNSFRCMLKHQEFSQHDAEETAELTENSLPALSKLPLDFYQNIPVALNFNPNKQKIDVKTGISRETGIICHRLLQWICDHHPASLEQIPWNLVQQECISLGFDNESQGLILEQIKDQITRMFRDPRGLWILSKHEQECNEYELLVAHQNKLATRILDRVFEDQGKFWIIDFKTGKEDQESLEQHQMQLNEYGYYLSERTRLPIHCGLYYLTNNHWHSWEYQMEATADLPLS